MISPSADKAMLFSICFWQMKGLRVAAVITLSEYHEDMTVGLQSVLKLREYFTEVHIVYPKGYPNAPGKSDFNGMPYHAHYEELTVAALAGALLVVHVRPDHGVDEPALVELLESAQENRRSCDHYAVRGRVDCDGLTRTYLLGFVWLLSYMDWFRTWLNWWGYHSVYDLRATKVVPEFPSGCIVPRYRHAWLFAVWSRVAWVRYSDQSLVVKPSLRPPPSAGGEAKPKSSEDFFVPQIIYTHPHISVWNVTWLVAFAAYYVCFALPWWNLYFENVAYTQLFVRPSLYAAWSWILWRNVLHPVWLALWGIQIVLCMWIVARRYKHASLGWVFLMPLYLTLSPLVFVLVRMGLFLPAREARGQKQKKKS
jgi:hypothetical protein